MNERIKELANQVDACYIPRYDMWQMDTETVEKFAELIVAECMNLVDRGGEFVSRPKLVERIKEHFGVEE